MCVHVGSSQHSALFGKHTDLADHGALQCATIAIACRQFPVTVHFSKRTELTDYTGAAARKAARIHKELPPGGILVFVTGKQEVQQVCAQLRASFFGTHGAARCGANDTHGGQEGAGNSGAGGGVAEEQEQEAGELDGADFAEAEADGAAAGHDPTTAGACHWRSERHEVCGCSAHVVACFHVTHPL